MIEDRVQRIQSTIESAPKVPDQTESEPYWQVAALKYDSEILMQSHRVLAGMLNRFATTLSNTGL